MRSRRSRPPRRGSGDFFRWQHLWPKFAEFYNLPLGEVQTIQLTEFIADQSRSGSTSSSVTACRRRRIARSPHGRSPTYVFGCDWDVMTDTLKLRAAGFHDCVRSDTMFLRLFERFRELRALPRVQTIPLARAGPARFRQHGAAERADSNAVSGPEAWVG
jgi:hypothetical protein